MDKLKNLISGKSDDASTGPTSEPSGKLTGEGSHLDNANMPGAWQEEGTTPLEATKGVGISTDPSSVPSSTQPSGPVSTEATRGSGISSSIGASDSAYSADTGSRAAAPSGSSPDAVVAASRALGASSGSASHHQTGTAPTSQNIGSTGSASSASHPISRDADAADSSSYPVGTAVTTAGSYAATGATPIADSFTQDRSTSGTEYAGGAAPGVSGQSEPHDAPFTISSKNDADPTRSSGATAGGSLTGQSLADRSRPIQGTSATVEPTYVERAQQLPGASSTATQDVSSLSGPTSTSAATAGTSTGLSGATDASPGGTHISKPFPSDPVSTEPLTGSSGVGSGAAATAAAAGGAGLAAAGASHYTGDSKDYSGPTDSGATSGSYTGGSAPGVAGQSVTESSGPPSGTTTGLGSDSTAQREPTSSATTGAYAGGSAPGVAGQSVTHSTPSTTATTQQSSDTKDSHYGRDTAAVAAAGGAGAAGAHEYSKHSHSSEQKEATTSSGHESDKPKESTASKIKHALGFGHKEQHSRFAETTAPGHTARDEYYNPAGQTTVPTQDIEGSSRAGRDTAAGVGAGALGAGGVAAYESSKSPETGVGSTQTAPPTSGAGASQLASSGSKPSGPGDGDQYDHLSSGTPSGVSTSDPAQAGVAGTGQSTSGLSSTATADGSSDAQNTSGHHYGRDAAAVAGLGGAGALGAHEYNKDRSTSATEPPSQSYNVASSQAYSGGGPSASTAQTSQPYSVGGTTADYTKQAPQYASHTPLASSSEVQSGASGSHLGRDAALGGTAAGVGGLGAYEATKHHGSSTADPAATAPSSSSAAAGTGTTETTGSSGYGDQYNHLADGTPSGIATSDPAHPSTEPTSSGVQSGTAGSHLGRDAALGGAAAGVIGTGAAAYSSSTSKDLTDTAGTTASSSGYGDQYRHLGHGTASGISTSDPAHPSTEPSSSADQQDTTSSHFGRDAALGGAAAGVIGTGAATYGSSTAKDLTSGTGTSGTAGSTTATASSGTGGYGDQYRHLGDGTPSGIATSDPAHPSTGPTSSESQGASSSQHHYGRDAALGGAAAGVIGTGAAAYGTSGSERTPTSTTGPSSTSAATGAGGDQYRHLGDGTASGIATSSAAGGPASSSATADTTGPQGYGGDVALAGAGAEAAGAGAGAYGSSYSQSQRDATTAGTTAGSSHSAPLSTSTHGAAQQGEEDDEPESPTGTGETKKKRGFLSKILHRDDPNKLHKEPKESRKSLEAEGSEIPKTTHEAYGSHVTGGKSTHIGTDGEIGRGGQILSGFGNQDPKEAQALSEAEKIANQPLGSGNYMNS